MVRRILRDAYAERRRPPDGPPAAVVEAPPATKKKGLGTLICEAVGEKGLVLEIPSRKGAGRREPIDFSRPDGSYDDDPPGPGGPSGPTESQAPPPKTTEPDAPLR